MGEVRGRLCGRPAPTPPSSEENAPREWTPRFSQSVGAGGRCGMKLYFSVQPRRSASGSGAVTCRGRSGGEAPQGGSPAAAARASRPSLGVSGSSMATRRRRRATPLTPHFQIKMAQAPGPGREASSQVCPKAAVPAETRELGNGAGTPFPAWKGLGRRKGGWGCWRWGGGPASERERQTWN